MDDILDTGAGALLGCCEPQCLTLLRIAFLRRDFSFAVELMSLSEVDALDEDDGMSAER